MGLVASDHEHPARGQSPGIGGHGSQHPIDGPPAEGATEPRHPRDAGPLSLTDELALARRCRRKHGPLRVDVKVPALRRDGPVMRKIRVAAEEGQVSEAWAVIADLKGSREHHDRSDRAGQLIVDATLGVLRRSTG